jgi:hypothetical protein
MSVNMSRRMGNFFVIVHNFECENWILYRQFWKWSLNNMCPLLILGLLRIATSDTYSLIHINVSHYDRFNPGDRVPCGHWGPQTWSGFFVLDSCCSDPQGNEPNLLGHRDRSLVTTRNGLSQKEIHYNWRFTKFVSAVNKYKGPEMYKI